MLATRWARGHRTYILTLASVLAQVAYWLVGDQSVHETLAQLILLALSLTPATLRAAIAQNRDTLLAAVADRAPAPYAQKAAEDLLAEDIWDLARSYGERPARTLPVMTGAELIEVIHCEREARDPPDA